MIDSRKTDILISDLKEIPHFLKKITMGENILLKDLENFLITKKLITNKVEKEKKLDKMRTSNIICANLKKNKIEAANTIKDKKNKLKDKR